MQFIKFIQNKFSTFICLAAILMMLTASLAAQEKIAFQSNRDGNAEIYVMNADGTGQTNLSFSGSSDTHPAISPDGSKIAFRSSRDGNNEIYVMNADGTNQTRLTVNAAADEEPAWSPDGTKIVFYSFRESGGIHIYVMNADGTNQTRLTSSAFNMRPTFSPTGNEIIFQSSTGGSFEIFKMNADGSNQVNLTNNPANDSEPSFSPDGTKIVFHSNRNGNSDIYVMNADGSNPVNLTSNNLTSDLEAVFNFDGSKIAFRSDRDGNSEIYVMNADGSNQINVSNNPSPDTLPSWGITPINAPTDLRVDAVTASQVNLAWTDASGNEDGYAVERCTGAGCTNFVEIGYTGADATVFSDSGIAKNTQYSYRIRAFNETGGSSYSNVLSVKTLKR